MSDLILAVDGGNSKTDLVLFTGDGEVLAAARGPSVSHQAVGLDEAARRLHAQVVAAAATIAGRDGGAGAERAATAGPTAGPIAALGVLCLAGMDLPVDERALARVHGRTGIATTLILENDTLAGLRAGSATGWGVGVVVGQGINAIGVAPDGRRARFAGLGSISGDRGGGSGLGMDALGAAVRAQDGRGPHTSLETLVPAHFGLRRPLDVTSALYAGRIDEHRTSELAPVAVAAAAAGDAVALGLIDDVADECAAFATAAIRRLRIGRLPVPVVLSGGVARGAEALLTDRVAERVRRVAPLASVAILRAPPVLGAALLALDRVAHGPDAETRLRDAITHERLLARE